ncbi:MAG: hypothetical protein HY744_21380 [Deltaproteobacteria bacterium]|nr:hypothetical protein [Deltaproteobacteria bacterium]
MSAPRDPELGELLDALEAGDFRLLGRRAAALARESESAAVRRAARDLARRIGPGRAEMYLLVLGVALLVVLAVRHLAGWL